jgi:glycosyltransferase involved in cell wall biosynthesis
VALAAALVRFLDEPGLWARLREAGLRNVSRFTWTSIAVQQRGLYERAVLRG